MTQDRPQHAQPPTEISDLALRWIMKLNSGTSTAEDRRDYQTWREQNELNEAAAKEAESLWVDAGNLQVDPVTGVVVPGRRQRGPTRRNIVTGVAGFATVGGGLWATGALRDWTADFKTGTGETRTISLPDGSQVTLNARSAVNLRYSELVRRIALLDGQAFFQVVPDRDRAFEVEANDVVTTAVGTAFDIDLNLSAGGVAISVTEHAVLVRAATNQSGVEPIKLLEGQTVLVDADGHIGEVMARARSVTAAWRNGIYIAENRSLGDVVAALQSYHRGWLIIRGADTARLRVNAVLNLRKPDESLDALANGLPIRVGRLSPYLVIISSA